MHIYLVLDGDKTPSGGSPSEEIQSCLNAQIQHKNLRLNISKQKIIQILTKIVNFTNCGINITLSIEVQNFFWTFFAIWWNSSSTNIFTALSGLLLIKYREWGKYVSKWVMCHNRRFAYTFCILHWKPHAWWCAYSDPSWFIFKSSSHCLNWIWQLTVCYDTSCTMYKYRISW